MRSEAYLHPVHKDLCSEKNETMVDSFKSLIQTKIVLILRYNRNNRTVIWKFATVYGVFNGRKSF